MGIGCHIEAVCLVAVEMDVTVEGALCIAPSACGSNQVLQSLIVTYKALVEALFEGLKCTKGKAGSSPTTVWHTVLRWHMSKAKSNMR